MGGAKRKHGQRYAGLNVLQFWVQRHPALISPCRISKIITIKDDFGTQEEK
jgi:hypothetical protein